MSARGESNRRRTSARGRYSPQPAQSRPPHSQSQPQSPQQSGYPALNVISEAPQGYSTLPYATPQYAPVQASYSGQYMMPPLLPYQPAFLTPAHTRHASLPAFATSASLLGAPMSSSYLNHHLFSPPHSPTLAPQMYAQPAQPAPNALSSSFAPHRAIRGQQDGEGGTWWYVPAQPQGRDDVPATLFRTSVPVAAASSQQQPQTSPYPALIEPSASEVVLTTLDDDKPPAPGLERRPYHPNAPANTSDWVMWAGNVPGDAEQHELWRFFTQPSDGSTQSGIEATPSSVAGMSGGDEIGRGRSGVLSIFLISRSSCAFVNYEAEAQLHAAIARFNGMSLRPADPRCPPLVCRVRGKEQDLGAGVGGQRGMGMHTEWVRVKEQKGSTDTSGPAVDDGPTVDDGSKFVPTNVNSVSASTTSSLLARHFPQRFFILKSLTEDELDMSVISGLWATQRHNEGVLDRAFRTAKDVFLVLSANKSGEFYGYARMLGPVARPISSRILGVGRTIDNSPLPMGPPGSSLSPPPNSSSTSLAPAPAGSLSPPSVVSPAPIGPLSLQRESPRPMLATALGGSLSMPRDSKVRLRDVHSAPALLGHVGQPLSGMSPALRYNLDQWLARPIQLDGRAPFRAMRGDKSVASPDSEIRTKEDDSLGGLTGASKSTDDGGPRDFKLQWLCTEHLPFQRTRHIRNPWNHDREVKVSRDGTELEPSVGQALLQEWGLFCAQIEKKQQK
ncbi:YT521-B-like domain-containing protein [Mycena galericulata]|nr:YT521-B-like domain-containing protein [Mycena galericulata]